MFHPLSEDVRDMWSEARVTWPKRTGVDGTSGTGSSRYGGTRNIETARSAPGGGGGVMQVDHEVRPRVGAPLRPQQLVQLPRTTMLQGVLPLDVVQNLRLRGINQRIREKP